MIDVGFDLAHCWPSGSSSGGPQSLPVTSKYLQLDISSFNLSFFLASRRRHQSIFAVVAYSEVHSGRGPLPQNIIPSNLGGNQRKAGPVSEQSCEYYQKRTSAGSFKVQNV